MSKERMVRDNTIKILSVIFAVLLWFYVITEQNPVVPKDITVPVKITNVEFLNRNNLVVIDNEDGYYITLKLKGKKELLDTVNQNTINAYADISDYLSVGEKMVPVVVNGIPEGVLVASRSEQKIKISLDNKLVVQRPVTISITGNPKGGLATLDAVLTPSVVVLTGAESIINKVQTIKVDLDIAGVDVSVNERLPVKLLDANGDDVLGIQINTPYINVVVPVANTKRVPIQLILEGEIPAGYVITDKQVLPKEILVTGNQEALDNLNLINTNKQMISNLTESVTLNVLLDLPEGIQLVNVDEKISAVLNIQRVTTNTFDLSDIEFLNLDPRYIVDNSPARTIRLTIRGPEKLLGDVQNSISLYVDLANAKDGEGNYTVSVNKSPMIEILSIEPANIGLDIKVRE